MLAVIGLILIVYRRGGHFQLNLAGLVNFAVDLPKHDVRAEIHYPILARAVADLGAIVQSKDYHSDLPKLYQDLLYGASRAGNGKECRVALMVPTRRGPSGPSDFAVLDDSYCANKMEIARTRPKCPTKRGHFETGE